MANTNFQSVDDYIATRPEATRPVLEKVRGAIRKALPGAKEVISYQIPAYKIHGSVAVYFAGWKEHFSIYPASEALAAAFAEELAGRVISKGTIRFPFSEPVPLRLIGAIAKFKGKEAAARLKAKAAISA